MVSKCKGDVTLPIFDHPTSPKLSFKFDQERASPMFTKMRVVDCSSLGKSVTSKFEQTTSSI